MPKTTEKIEGGFDLDSLISNFKDAPEVSSIIPNSFGDLKTDVAKIPMGKVAHLSTKISFNTYGWENGNYARFAGVHKNNFAINTKDNDEKFIKNNFLHSLSTGLGVEIEYVVNTNRSGEQTGISLYTSKEQGKVYSAVEALLKSWKIDTRIYRAKNAYIKLGRDKTVDGSDEFIPLNLGKIWGYFVLINPADANSFKTPRISFDWPSIDSYVRLNSKKPSENECVITRINQNMNLGPIDFNYRSGYQIVFFAKGDDDIWELCTINATVGEHGKVSQIQKCYRGEKDQKLSDLIAKITGSSVMEIINSNCNFVNSLDKIEAATAEIYSKNEIEASELIYIVNHENVETENFCIGDAVKSDSSEDEEDETVENSDNSELTTPDEVEFN